MFSFRFFLLVVGNLMVLVALLPGSETLEIRIPQGAQFVRPTVAEAPVVRWAWPSGGIDRGEAERGVRELASLGYGGALITFFTEENGASGRFFSRRRNWGSKSWKQGLEAALSAADEEGITVDVMMGPGALPSLPELTPNRWGAALEMVVGMAEVEGGTTFYDRVPTAVLAPRGADIHARLERMQVARVLVAGSIATGERWVLDPNSVVEIGAGRSPRDVELSVLEPGKWVLLAYWVRGSGQVAGAGGHAGGAAYLVNPFGRSGSSALMLHWERKLFDEGLAERLARNGSSLVLGAGAWDFVGTPWSSDVIEAFGAAKGQSALPFLPLLSRGEGAPHFDFPAKQRLGVGAAWEAFLGSQYELEFLVPLQGWLKNHGVGLKADPFGDFLSASALATRLKDILTPSGGRNASDRFRLLSTVRALEGRMEGSITAEVRVPAEGGVEAWDRFWRDVHSAWIGGADTFLLDGRLSGELADGVTESEQIAKLSRLQWAAQMGEPYFPVGVWPLANGSESLELDWGRNGWEYGVLGEGAWLDQGTAELGEQVQAIGLRTVVLDGRGEAPIVSTKVIAQWQGLAELGLSVMLVGDWSRVCAKPLDSVLESELETALQTLIEKEGVSVFQNLGEVLSQLRVDGVEPVVSRAQGRDEDAADDQLPSFRVRQMKDGSLFLWWNPSAHPWRGWLRLSGLAGRKPGFALDPATGSITAIRASRMSATEAELRWLELPANGTAVWWMPVPSESDSKKNGTGSGT